LQTARPDPAPLAIGSLECRNRRRRESEHGLPLRVGWVAEAGIAERQPYDPKLTGLSFRVSPFTRNRDEDRAARGPQIWSAQHGIGTRWL
jgi:hypothetical protein